MLKKQEKRHRKHKRVRAKIFGTAKRPRFCAFRSANHIYAQLINDENGKTLFSVSDLNLPSKKTSEKNKKDLKGKMLRAYEIGRLIAKKATENKIKEVVFDRGGYKYHGRVKALAEGAREGGLKF